MKRTKRAPKYSIAYDSKRSGETGRKQYPTFTSYAAAKKAVAEMNRKNMFPTSGSYVVIEL